MLDEAAKIGDEQKDRDSKTSIAADELSSRPGR
jgi:hypothetical protein